MIRFVSALLVALAAARCSSGPSSEEVTLDLFSRIAFLFEHYNGALGNQDPLRLEGVTSELRRVVLAHYPRVLEGLSSADPVIRADAAFALGFSKERGAAGPLAAAASDPESPVRSNAIASLGMLGFEEVPTEPFAKAVVQSAHGVAITSATLRDGTGDQEKDWAAAEVRTGARHLARPAIRAHAPSPFDYAGRTRVFIVTDIDRNSVASVSAAYRELILAAGGGTLGLFTAIQRLRRVYDKIAPALDEAGVPLLAQHVDNMNLTSLIDIFRSERDTCLLGTDAVRDGVDVPGASLRLIVFDRVPWPRPTILHRERRKAFGGAAYDDMIARLRMKQAYGRLIRRADDFGVFVMLDRMLPSRLLGALPPGVAVERTGLADTIAKTRAFLAERMGNP